jgi:hypothetical protein
MPPIVMTNPLGAALATAAALCWIIPAPARADWWWDNSFDHYPTMGDAWDACAGGAPNSPDARQAAACERIVMDAWREANDHPSSIGKLCRGDPRNNPEGARAALLAEGEKHLADPDPTWRRLSAGLMVSAALNRQGLPCP